MTQSRPAITGTTHTLPFDKLSPHEFERLCLWLVEREGYERAEHLGAAGSEQGRDIVAWREGELWAFQCKRVQRFGPTDALREVEKVLILPEVQRPVGLVFLVTCDVSAHTRQQARARCAGMIECHFWTGTELDTKVKQSPDIVDEFFQPSAPSLWDRFRQRPMAFYPALALFTLLVVFALTAGLVGIGADIGGARQQFQAWGLLPTPTPMPTPTPTPLPLVPASQDETLVLVATFHRTEGVVDTDAHNEIRYAIQKAARELGLSHLRTEVEPTCLRADDRAGAEELGQRYNASIVIWGGDTGVRVTVNFLNLKQPDLDAAEVRISETEFTQLANPSAYAEFVTQGLPGQITFLSLFAVGQSYYVEEAYADSLEVIEKAIDSLASETEPLEGLADAYFRVGWLQQSSMGDDEQAIADYDHAIALDPDYAAAYFNRGNARGDLGDLEGAIADYDQAIALAPQDAMAYNNRGWIRQTQGDLEGAIADYDQAIALDPELVHAYNNRGLARQTLGDLEGAIADYDQAIALDPQDDWAYHNRGLARQTLGDLEGAIADYDQAIALDPQDTWAYYHRGLARQTLGDLEGAIADYDQAITLDPQDTWAYNNRGWIRQTQGDLEGAIADYDQAIALDPQNAMAYNNRGLARQALGDLEAAIADYSKAAELQPDNADAYNGLCWVYGLEQKPELAMPHCQQAIEIDPHPGYIDSRGLAHALLGDYEAAIADFQVTVDWLEQQPGDEGRAILDRRKAWIEMLTNGQNPFTPEVLAELCAE